MAVYKLRRLTTKTFGIIGSTVGAATETTGDVMKSGVGQLGGAFAGGKFLGDAFGSALESAGVPMAGAIGTVAGAVTGAKAMKTVGQAISDSGTDMAMKAQMS